MQPQVQETQVSWGQLLGMLVALGQRNILAWIATLHHDETKVVPEAPGGANEVHLEVLIRVLVAMGDIVVLDQKVQFVDASQLARLHLQAQVVVSANLLVAILVALGVPRLDSAGLLVGVFVSVLASAFAFRAIYELLLAPAHKQDIARLCIDDNGSEHTATTHSVEQGIFDLCIQQYVSKAASFLRNEG